MASEFPILVIPSEGTSVPMGSVVIIEEPYVSALKFEYRQHFCDFCLISVPVKDETLTVKEFKLQTLKNCSKCHAVYYCEKKCQVSAWPEHKVECPGLRDVASSLGRDTFQQAVLKDTYHQMLLYARALSKSHTDKGKEAKTFGDGLTRRFADLQDTTSDCPHDFKQFDQFARQVLPKAILDAVSSKDRLACYWRCRLNFTPVSGISVSSEEVFVGLGIYLSVSHLEHACAPSAIFFNMARVMHVRTIQDIEDFSWNKVRISYKPNLEMEATISRRKTLRESYFFHCKCWACEDTRRDCFMSAMICDSCGDGALPLLTPVDAKDAFHHPSLPCLSCGAELTNAERLEQLRSISKEAWMYSKNAPLRPVYTHLKDLLARQEGFVHPFNKLRVDLQTMILVTLECTAADIARIRPQLKAAYEYYCGAYSPRLVEFFCFLSFTLAAAEDTHGADEALKESMRIADVIYGKHHPSHQFLRAGLPYKRAY